MVPICLGATLKVHVQTLENDSEIRSGPTSIWGADGMTTRKNGWLSFNASDSRMKSADRLAS